MMFTKMFVAGTLGFSAFLVGAPARSTAQDSDPSSSAPQKEERQNENDAATYYAPKVGHVRVYEVKQGDALLSEITEVVTKVEVIGGWLRVSTDTKANGKPQATSSSFGPPLKLPVKVGDSWTKDIDPKQERSPKTSYKVVKVEEIAVPAGTFKALRVETTLTAREGLSTDTIY